MRTENIKSDVLKVRIDSETLQLIEQARAHVNLDKSKFIRQCIQERSKAIISEHERTRFNTEDWELFFSMLDNPPKPTERMKMAAKTYQKIIAANEI
ncbi:DUF1778 domain-containing protein [Methyloprofundus sp.]|uniref:type II toxin-antitoxin system TacA family antitoxin n=1 Tax=Methyloprofundus sp. TaxID=2020875 RepID=UPI003D0E735A